MEDLTTISPSFALFKFSLLLLIFSSLTETCSPDSEGFWRASMAEKSHRYEDILYGKVQEVYPDPRFDYGGGSHAYTVRMKVFCIYKGPTRSGIVNITEAGIIPGKCHHASLTRGATYVVLVDRTDGVLRVAYEAEGKDALYNVTRACGLSLNTPTGVDRYDVDCIDPALPGDCKENPWTIDKKGEKNGNGYEELAQNDGHDPDDHHQEGHGHADHEDEHEHSDHDHEQFDHEGHDHQGHTHDEHDTHDHDHHEGSHDDGHVHGGHSTEDHHEEGHGHSEHKDDDAHDHTGHDHDEFEHEGHDHKGHTHEEHDLHDHEHHEGEDGHEHDHKHEKASVAGNGAVTVLFKTFNSLLLLMIPFIL